MRGTGVVLGMAKLLTHADARIWTSCFGQCQDCHPVLLRSIECVTMRNRYRRAGRAGRESTAFVTNRPAGTASAGVLSQQANRQTGRRTGALPTASLPASACGNL